MYLSMTYSLLSMYPERDASVDAASGVYHITYPLKVRALGYETVSTRQYSWDPVRHMEIDCWILQFSLQGGGWFQEFLPGVDSGKPARRMERGDAFLINPSRHHYHYWCDGSPWEFMWISLHGDFADSLCSTIAGHNMCFSCTPDSGAAAVLQEILTLIESGNLLDADALFMRGSELLLQLFHMVFPPITTPGEYVVSRNPFSFEQQIAAFISAHLREVDVGMIAEAFGYNPKYVMSRYKKLTGKTLHSVIVEAKIAFAVRLLTETSLSIEEIAEYLSFSDRFHFSKVFKAVMGSSPGEYIRKHRVPFSTKEFV